MTDGAGLRQSHFGSGYDAGKARLQAEVEQLRAKLADEQANANMHRELAAIVARDLQEARQIIAAMEAVVEAARESAREGHREHCRVEYRHCTCSHEDLVAALQRFDSAGVPTFCSKCGGSGFRGEGNPNTDADACPKCDGEGIVPADSTTEVVQ